MKKINLLSYLHLLAKAGKNFTQKGKLLIMPLLLFMVTAVSQMANGQTKFYIELVAAGDNNSWAAKSQYLNAAPELPGAAINTKAFDYPDEPCISPAIIAHPVAASTCTGGEVSFAVEATGTNLSYQWKKNGTDIDGATGTTYIIAVAGTGDAANYLVTVSGDCGSPVTSDVAALIVNTPTVITAQPASVSACVGEVVSFSVAATGTALSYQWLKNLKPIPGATGSTYNLTIASFGDLGNYSVRVSGACRYSLSNTAVLKVKIAPVITTQPIAATVCARKAASFSVTAVGTGLSYQWLKNGIAIPGATASTYTIATAGVADAAEYSVVVSSDCAPVSSNKVPLIVNPSPVATITASGPTTICAKGSVTLTASNGASYVWSNGSTQSSITVTEPGSYSVSITNASGCSATSAAEVVTVLASTISGVTIPDALALPNGTAYNTVYNGYDPAAAITLKVSVSAPGGQKSYSYQWSNGATSSAISVSPTKPTEYTVTVFSGKTCAQVTKLVNVVDVRCGARLDMVSLCAANSKNPKDPKTYERICTAATNVPAHLKKGGYLGNCQATASARPAEESTGGNLAAGIGLNIKAFPNPSSNFFKLIVNSGNVMDKVRVTITDELGRVRETRSINAGQILQFGESYQAGMYVVQAVQGSQVITAKLIRQAR